MTETQLTGTRTRTFSWSDPQVYAEAAPGRSGIELLRLVSSGELPPPPVMEMIGLDRLDVVEEGRVTAHLRAKEFHYNPIGSVHGGVISTVLDTVTGCAVHTTLDAGVGYTSLDLTVKFLRPVTVASGMLRCEGEVISRGRTTALAEGRLYDEAGRLVAHATSSCMIFPAGRS